MCKLKAAQWRDYIIDIAIPTLKGLIDEYESTTAIDLESLKLCIEYLYNLLFVAYRVKQYTPQVLGKVHQWCKNLGIEMELLLGAEKITPKMHMSRHFGKFIELLGPLTNFDTFQFENLLSTIRRALLSTKKPEIQGLHILKKTVMIPVMNEVFGTQSAMDDFMNIKSQQLITAKAANGSHVWSVSTVIYEIQEKLSIQQVISTFRQHFPQQQFEQVLFFASAKRIAFEGNQTSNDFGQSCTYLKGSWDPSTRKKSRFDMHVCVNNGTRFCADINCFVLYNKQIWCLVDTFESQVHDLSEQLNGIHEKYYFTSPLQPSTKAIVALGSIEHKCNVLGRNTHKVWFY